MRKCTRLGALFLAVLLLAGCAASVEAPPHSMFAPAIPASRTLPAKTLPEYDPWETINAMTLDEKIYQLFIVAPEDLEGSSTVTFAPENLSELLKQKPVGGIIFFASNLRDREQTEKLIGDFQAASPTPLFIAVDEEGGLVRRLGSNPSMGFTQIGAMGTIADADAAKNVGITIGSELKELGFNLDFAPVADVNTNPKNPVIGSRAFRSDAAEAAELVAACTEGFIQSGVISCLKHFPGHGDTVQDSHRGYAESTRTLEELEQTEFPPFQSGIQAGAPLVMMGHISLPNAAGSDGLPASLSPFWMQEILREKLGFGGLIITDSLEMGAVTSAFPIKGDSSLQALLAGADLLLMPDSLTKAVAAIRASVENGTIPESRIDESLLRILTLKHEYGIIKDPIF